MDEDNPLDKLSDDDLQKLMSLGVIPDRQGRLQQQQLQAQKLSDSPDPQMVGYGRTAVAASPLSFLAQVVNHYKGEHQLKDLDAQQQGLNDQQVAGRMAYARALRGPHNPDGSRVNPMMQDVGVDPSNMPSGNFNMPQQAASRAPPPAPMPAPVQSVMFQPPPQQDEAPTRLAGSGGVPGMGSPQQAAQGLGGVGAMPGNADAVNAAMLATALRKKREQPSLYSGVMPYGK